MKFIRFFIVTVVALFSLEFSTVSAAPALAAGQTKFSKGSNTAHSPQHRIRHRRRNLHRIHRHHK